MALNGAPTNLMTLISHGWTNDPKLQTIISALQHNAPNHPKYTYVNQQLRRKGKLVVSDDQQLKHFILQWLHRSPTEGHSGRNITLQRIKALFYWKGITKDVQHFIGSCDVCQRCKRENVASPGLLQPLPIPHTPWDAVSLDFIEGLPNSFGKTLILVVVDCLTNYAHFIAL